MFGILNGAFRVATRNENGPGTNHRRSKSSDWAAKVAHNQPAKLRFRSPAEAESWASKL